MIARGQLTSTQYRAGKTHWGHCSVRLVWSGLVCTARPMLANFCPTDNVGQLLAFPPVGEECANARCACASAKFPTTATTQNPPSTDHFFPQQRTPTPRWLLSPPPQHCVGRVFYLSLAHRRTFLKKLCAAAPSLCCAAFPLLFTQPNRHHRRRGERARNCFHSLLPLLPLTLLSLTLKHVFIHLKRHLFFVRSTLSHAISHTTFYISYGVWGVK